MKAHRAVRWGFSALLAFLPLLAHPQSYPVKPVRLVLAFAGGGETNVRLVANKAQEHLGQPLIVDPQPAAGGILAASAVARAAPDGYTILAGTINTHIYRPLRMLKIPYDPIKDFTPITRLTVTTSVLAVNNELGINSVQELVARAKRDPGKVFIGTWGTGGSQDLSILLLENATGARFTVVPYKDDVQPTLDASTGRIQGVIGVGSQVGRFAQKGGLKMLAVINGERRPGFESVPSIVEQVPGYQPLSNFAAFYGPAGLSGPAVERLRDAFTRGMMDPGVHAKLLTVGSVPSPTTAEELDATLKREIGVVAKLLKQAGLEPE